MISRHLCAISVIAFGSLAVGQDPKTDILSKPSDDRREQTHLRRITDRAFVHDLANVAYKIPDGWEELPPHRLARKIDQRITSVLAIRRTNGDLAATLSWIPMDPGQKLSDWVRDTAVAGEFGEEYETLKAVYGKDRVTAPVKVPAGDFDVYRINIEGAPERGEKYDGALAVFEVQSEKRSWLLKARISFPKGDRIKNDQVVMDVLKGYSKIPAKGGSDSK